MTRARLAAALLATGDLAAWPLGVLGFLVRGGIVVLALPILTLPSPVGLVTSLGPSVISTGRIDGPLRGLLLGWGIVLAVVAAGALLASASVERAVHERQRPVGVAASVPSAATKRRLVLRLLAVELIALAPLAVVATLSVLAIVDAVRAEFVLPGDLAQPFIGRIIGAIAIPLAALVVALLVTEAIDGVLTRRILVPRGRRRMTRLWVWLGVVGTAIAGWALTLGVVVPGLALVTLLWQATRIAWGILPIGPSDPISAASLGEVIVAAASLVLLVAAWLAVLVLGGLASLARAALWTSRIELPAGAAGGTGRASDT